MKRCSVCAESSGLVMVGSGNRGINNQMQFLCEEHLHKYVIDDPNRYFAGWFKLTRREGDVNAERQ